ncbi:MAG TPA: hypothetical protein VGS58_10525, partial [Candidatus Sulfopaludibacter sp.]|nr:hypothetical protein [Candidatus Sulfopaludibacter sp.]
MRLLRIAIVLAVVTAAYADVITLKSGRVINGTYLGGSPRELKVQVGDQIETLDVSQVAKIEFGNGSQASAPAPDRPMLRRAPDSSADAPPPLRRSAPPVSASDDSRPTLRRE